MEAKLSQKTLRRAAGDPTKSARVARLVHVSDSEPGIRRKRKGKRFVYLYRGRPVTSEAVLRRIRSLVIPPGWSDVWICRKRNGHLQATGRDALSRKQYRYHPRWTALRGRTKFYRMEAFGRALPAIRRRLQVDLACEGLTREKVLALVVALMEQTHMRLGNAFYERLYGSYGLVTLKTRHVHTDGTGIRFVFKGKKAVAHDITVHNKKLAQLVSRCREIPGGPLFRYYDEDQRLRRIHSGDVNRYIGEITGSNFTSKDFRTWAGSIAFIRAVTQRGDDSEGTAAETVMLLDRVAASLGNTRAVCRKYYVYPQLITLFENGRLVKAMKEPPRPTRWLSREERLLVALLSDSIG